MNQSPSVVVESTSKRYIMWKNPGARLTSPLKDQIANLFPFAPGAQKILRSSADKYRETFWALKDVNFSLQRGESIGILGRNGAGKSTLLQILAGTLTPSSGSVKVEGKVAALLELGSGFNPEFTGRENIHLSAAILGMNSKEIGNRMNSIINYADIGDFIDHPVRTYSSGMHIRLAFAVSAHVDADILIIDEALGVGDARFQLKCAKTIDGFIEEGKTLIFVSHDFSSIKRLCQRAILLEKGHCIMDGSPNDVINFYTKLLSQPKPVEELREEVSRLQNPKPDNTEPVAALEVPAPLLPSTPQPAEANADTMAAMRAELLKTQQALASLTDLELRSGQIAALQNEKPPHEQQFCGKEFSYGGTEGTIEKISMTDDMGEPQSVFTSGGKIQVSFEALAHQPVPAPLYALTVKSVNGQDLYVTNTMFHNIDPPGLEPGNSFRVSFRLELNLMAGEYFISLGWVTFEGEDLKIIHRRYDVLSFKVLPVDRRVGIANLHSKISFTH